MAISFPTDTRELRRVASLALDMYVKSVIDQVFETNAVWGTLTKRRNARKVWTGGARIGQPVRLDLPSNVGSYRGYDVLDNTPQDTRTVGLWETSEYYAAVTVSFRDMDLINGESAVVNFLQEESQQALEGIADLMNKHLWLDGSGNSGKDLEGFALNVPGDPTTGSYGGISRANTAWRNKFLDGGGNAANIIANLRTLTTQATSGTDAPDVIFTNRAGRDAYEALLVATLETDPVVLGASAQTGDGSIPNLRYRGAEIVVDENATPYGSTPGNSTFVGLNTKYTSLYTHRNRDMKMGELKEPERQTVLTGFVTWHGQYIVTQPRRQFVLFNAS